MKLFDPHAALAKIANQAHTPATPATIATDATEITPNVAKVAGVAAPRPEILKFEQRPQSGIPADCRHGIALGGRPKTWTGKIISLADWRRLSDWEKHGPDGRHWNGKTRQWEADKR